MSSQPQWQRNQELSKKARAGDQKARNSMILENLKVANHCAYRYSRHKDLYQDLKQVALQALVAAVDNYDPKKGMASFSHYASWRIRADLSRAFERSRAIMPIGDDHSRRCLTRAVPKAAKEAELAGKELTAEDLATALDIDLQYAKDLLEAHSIQIVQLGHHSGNQDTSDNIFFDVPDPAPSVVDQAVEAEDQHSVSETVQAALSLLSDNERAIIVARTMVDEPESYSMISRRLKLKVEQVKRIELRAKKKLVELLG